MMRAYAIVCACLLLLLTGAHAQTNPCSDPVGGTVIDTMYPRAIIEVQGTNVTITWTVIASRASDGMVDYRVDVGTIRLSGDDPAINQVTTLALFDAIDKATVAQGVAKGLTPCPPSCDQPSTARVIQQGCVLRVGTGTGTQFQPCADPGCCTRLYTVCCPNGVTSPVITLVSSEGPTCSGQGACQSTCP